MPSALRICRRGMRDDAVAIVHDRRRTAVQIARLIRAVLIQNVRQIAKRDADRIARLSAVYNRQQHFAVLGLSDDRMIKSSVLTDEQTKLLRGLIKEFEMANARFD